MYLECNKQGRESGRRIRISKVVEGPDHEEFCRPLRTLAFKLYHEESHGKVLSIEVT